MRGPTPALMEAMAKLADREIKAGRMLDSGGLMPVADGQGSAINRVVRENREVVSGLRLIRPGCQLSRPGIR